VSETRALIFGSCVSRDTFEFLPEGFRLLSYVARQSSISVDAPAAGLQSRLTGLPSAFQNRMVSGDVRGDFLDVAERLAPEVDLLLLDLVDERGGVIATDGGYVTRLAELWSAGGREATRGGTHVAFGTDEHFALWTAAVTQVVERLRELGLAERTVVLRTPWADRLAEGGPVPVPDWMTEPAVANAQYVRYFDTLAKLDLAVVELPAELARSTADHRWGPSPFHYTAEAYEFLAAAIAAAASAHGRRDTHSVDTTDASP